MQLETDSLRLLEAALREMEEGFAQLPEPGSATGNGKELTAVLRETAHRLQNNYPYFHPLYAGQMLKPPHPVARAAYALATWINPNNHALDGGKASSAMEREAVAEIAAMYGWNNALGHLTGGGTMANLEALWVAGREQPGKTILASAQSHYTHERMSGVLRLPFAKVPTDVTGRMDLAALETIVEQGNVGCVVATMGTTGFGAVDPLPEILNLSRRYGFRVHADCAYGGYFTLAGNLAPAARAGFDALSGADSIVIDPHKHGLQPYGCGCVLFRDASVVTYYGHESPFTYFTSAEAHLGQISLECSRPGASAVALWATQRLMPLVKGGDFALGLEASRRAAQSLVAALGTDPRYVVPVEPELDIVVWGIQADSASEASVLAQRVFDEAANEDLHLALIHVPVGMLRGSWKGLREDRDQVTCLRSVLMKPEHEAWLPEILARLDRAVQRAKQPE
jgi:tyrosine decarboxylase/aspartate 1-decarboxylase